MWESEGGRKGPGNRKESREEEDVLSEKVVELGLDRILKGEKGWWSRSEVSTALRSLELGVIWFRQHGKS